MNRQTFIDTLRRALYGRVSDYELADHIRYYEDYIQQEIIKEEVSRRFWESWVIQG